MQIRRKGQKYAGEGLAVLVIDEESPSCYLQKIHPREGYGWTVYSKDEYEMVPEERWEDVTGQVVQREGSREFDNPFAARWWSHELWYDNDKLAILVCGGNYRLVRDRRGVDHGDVMYRIERKVSS